MEKRFLQRLALVPAAPDLDDIRDDVLDDMSLKGPVERALTLLDGLDGYHLVPYTFKAEVDRTERKAHLLSRVDEKHHVVELPAVVLRSGSSKCMGILAQLPLIFPMGSSVYLVGHEVDALPLTLMNVIKHARLIKLRFVPWLHITGPPGGQQRAMLLTAFDLSTTTADARPRHDVTPADLEVLVREIKAFLRPPGGSEAQHRYDELVAKLKLAAEDQEEAIHLWESTEVSAMALADMARRRGRRMLGPLIRVLFGFRSDAARTLFEMATRCALLGRAELGEMDRKIKEQEPPD